jgi:hypothetical protein
LLESIVGGTVAALVTAKPAEASASMSFALGANSKSISAADGTFGFGNQGGVKGYYWDTINFSTNTIKLSHNRRTSSYSSMNYVTDFDWAEGDIISMVNDNNYFARSVITSVDKANSTITVDSLPFTEIKYSTGLLDSLTLKPHDRTIFAVYQNDSNTIKTGKPRWVSRSGSVELGFGNFTLGVMNLNTGNASFTSGYNNWAGGSFGAAIGRDNRSGYAAFAGGVETKADAYASIAYGLGLLNTSSSAAVFGQYNDITDIENMLLVVGCGSSDSDRKNALTVSRTGDVKAKGNIYSDNEKVLTAKDFGGNLEDLTSIDRNYAPIECIYGNEFDPDSNWNDGKEGADSYITNSELATEDLTGVCAHDVYVMLRGGYPAASIELDGRLRLESRSAIDQPCRYKFFDTITHKKYLDSTDLGRRIKVYIYYNPTYGDSFQVGLMSAYGNEYSSKFYTKAVTDIKNIVIDEEHYSSAVLSFNVTIDETMIADGIGLVTIALAGGGETVMIDHIECEEMISVASATTSNKSRINSLESKTTRLSDSVDELTSSVTDIVSALETNDDNINIIVESLQSKADNERFDSIENPLAYLFEQDFSVIPDNWNNGKETTGSYITNSSLDDFTGMCSSSIYGAIRGGSGIKTIEFTTFRNKTCFHIYATSKCRYKFFNTITDKGTLTQADLGRRVRITAKYCTVQGSSNIGLMSPKSDLYGQSFYKKFVSQTATGVNEWTDLDVVVTIDQTMIDESAALLTFDISANSEMYFTDIRCVELSSIEDIIEDIVDSTSELEENRTHYEDIIDVDITLLENERFNTLPDLAEEGIFGRFQYVGPEESDYTKGIEDIKDSCSIIINIAESIFKGKLVYDSLTESFTSTIYPVSGRIYEYYGDDVNGQVSIKNNIIDFTCSYFAGDGVRPDKISIIGTKKILKQLDEKYIPDTIARKTDVEELANAVNQINLFDGNYSEGIDIGGSSNSTTTASGMTYKTSTTPKRTSTIILEVEPNTTYSIIKEKTGREGSTSGAYYYFKVAAATKLMTTNNEKFDGSFSYSNTADPTTNYTFTTGSNDKYVYIMTSINLKPFVQIVKGTQTEFTVSDYESNPFTIKGKDVTATFNQPQSYLNNATKGKLNFYKWLDKDPRKSGITSNSNCCPYIVITSGRNTYTFVHDISTSINLDTWRWYNQKLDGDVLWASSDESVTNTTCLWNQTDNEGVIKQQGAADFIGGFHGDEKYTGITILVDGEEISESEFTIRHNCKNITLIVTSNVYFCEDTQNIAFNRTKKIEFIGDKVTVYNTWEYVGSSTFAINRSTLGGLYSVRKVFLNGVSSNAANKYFKSTTTTSDSSLESWNKDLDIVAFYGKDFTLYIRSLVDKGEYYKGCIQDSGTQERYKAYLDDINSSSGTCTLSTGDILRGCFEIETLS